MLWGMGQMGPVLVSVSFTLKSVTKLNSVKHLRSRTHLDTVVRAPAPLATRLEVVIETCPPSVSGWTSGWLVAEID